MRLFGRGLLCLFRSKTFPWTTWVGLSGRGEVEMGVRAPFFLIPGRREICHGRPVVYGSVLERHFIPCGRLGRRRIDDVQTLQ